MVETVTLQELELRRRLLLAESELNRLALQQGLHEVRERTQWMSEWRSSPKSGLPWMTVTAPAAGLFAAGALLRRGTFFGRVSGILRIAAVVYPFVKAWHLNRQAAKAPAPKTVSRRS